MSAGLNAQRWWRVLSRGATGAVLALSLAAIQWLPGLEAIRNSQRGSGVVAAAGSYPRPFSILWLVPYINGGYGHLGEAQFFSQYNLPEVGVYLGILPLVAIITLLHPRWPSRIAPRDRLTWYAVGLFGYLLALGSNTPLEHLFNSLPLYGHQRLQSRNMITVATAACVLFAGWIDRSERPQTGDAMTRYERVMGLRPLRAPGCARGVDPGLARRRGADLRRRRHQRLHGQHGARGGAHRPPLLCRCGRCRVATRTPANHVVALGRRRLRRRGHRRHGLDQPADRARPPTT